MSNNFLDRKTDRQNTIYIYKIIFTILVLHLHYYSWYGKLTGGWYIAVEFFFVVSGYLFADELFGKGIVNTNLSFFCYKKLKRLIPHYLIALCLLSFVLLVKGSKITISEILCETFGLTIFKLSKTINIPDWYVVVLIWTEILLFLVFKFVPRHKAKLVINILGVLSLFVYTICIIKLGSCDFWGWNHLVIISDGLIRGFAGISLGMYIWSSNENTGKVIQSKMVSGFCLNCVAFVCFFLAVILSYVFQWSRIDTIVLLLLLIGIKLSFNRNAAVSINPLIRKLSYLTYIAYLNQKSMIMIFHAILGNNMHKIYVFILFVVILFLFSYILDRIVCFVVKIFKNMSVNIAR